LEILDDYERLGSRQLGREFVKSVSTSISSSRVKKSNSSDRLLPVATAFLPPGLRALRAP
jgi:hypothetical protein